jgi:dihydrofolate synthase/folylpolyglutamate synthase
VANVPAVADAPYASGYRASAWGDPLDRVVAELMPSYNSGQPRHDLGAVERLTRLAQPLRSPRAVVLVGTNGKTSTATYLARFLTGAGRRAGLYTSPHIRAWTERIRVDLDEVTPATFERALLRMHAAVVEAQPDARPGDLRFFDVLTLAAEHVFGGAGVEFGVFEAGIGGRLDATRTLDPELVLLTSIGVDHEGQLGTEASQRLREKALATPEGATLISAPLGEPLETELAAIARARGFALDILDTGRDEPRHGDVPAFQTRNERLARAAAAHLLPGAALPAIATQVDARFEAGRARGIPYIVDVAHNPTAWEAFGAELPDSRHVLVVAITEPRSVADLVRELVAIRHKVGHVVATTTRVRPARPPESIADGLAGAGISAVAVPDPDAAFATAITAATATGAPLAVFGSTFVAVDFLAFARLGGKVGHHGEA